MGGAEICQDTAGRTLRASSKSSEVSPGIGARPMSLSSAAMSSGTRLQREMAAATLHLGLGMDGFIHKPNKT
jgi:hypothetical protein